MTAAIVVFLITYYLNVGIITVLYHRALAHGALKLTNFGIFVTKNVGVLLTGIDPKGWVCMHRLHHRHSDTPQDPHSPVNSSIIGVFFSQHKAFSKVLIGLLKRKKEYTDVVRDVPFEVHWLNKMNLWWLPIIVHAFIGAALGVITSNYLLGVGYVAGMSSHPIQGWMVNSFGHAVGYSNFNLGDNSKNNTFVAWTVVGEGYQNNHHRYPTAAKFSVKWFEVDTGYVLVHLFHLMGLVKFNTSPVVEDLCAENSSPVEQLA